MSKRAKRQTWDKEAVWEEASKYKTNADFRAGSESAWAYSYKKSYLKDLQDAFFMPPKKRVAKWNSEAIAEDALQYSTRNEFVTKSSGAYSAARTQGILDEVCSHMKPVQKNVFSNMKLKTGIYFLYQDDNLVYIGKSTMCISTRLSSHHYSKGKIFNKAVVYEINNIADINITEMYLIAKHNPKYNRDGNTTSVPPTVTVLDIDNIIVNEYKFNLGDSDE